jgi:23S rRNA pseudouridine2605 synthase
MFEAVGKHVEELTRLEFAGIGLGHLKPGQYRKLNPNEVSRLMSL